MKLVSLLFLFSIVTQAQAQVQLNGKIFDELGFVVPNVLVYIDGSTLSTQTNHNGEFYLNIPKGNYTLVCRDPMFKTMYIKVDESTKLPIQIILKEVVELKEAVISKISDEDWQYYYEEFSRSFLGKNTAAQKTTIENPKALRFFYDKQEQVLVAKAKEPLLITNKHLGYTIEYDLYDFSINYKTKINNTLGTTYFKTLKGNRRKRKKWIKYREESYQGSITHFMQSLYNKKLKEEGFVLKRLVRKENPEYKKYKEKLKKQMALGNVTLNGKIPPKIIETLYTAEVPYDSLIIKNNNQTKIQFKGYYLIEFIREKEDPMYVKHVKGMANPLVGNQVSVISILSDSLTLEENGNFYHPSNLLTEGYFTWEKIANMLPLDFKPTLQ